MKQVDIENMIGKWQTEGVVSAEQAQHMRNDVSHTSSEKSGDRFIAAVMLVGASALSLGVLLIIASNWRYLGAGVKTILALLMPIIPISFAYYQLQVRGKDTVLGRASGIVGLALVGGALAMIGQIYNLESNWMSMLWMWFILTVPLVFVFKHPENVIFSATLLGGTLLYSLVDLLDVFDNTRTAVILLTGSSLFYAYLLYSVGTMVRFDPVWGSSARYLRLGAASLTVTTLFITTFDFYAKILMDTKLWGSNDGSWIILAVVCNVTFIGFLLFVLFRAIKHEEMQLAVSVLRLFGIYLLVKYITLFSDMFDTGFFLILGGALFIGGAWALEKNKHALISRLRPEPTFENPPTI